MPEGNLFMMDDNRDMSEDRREPRVHRSKIGLRDPARRYTTATLPDKHAGRAIGFVPIGMVIARVRKVMPSYNLCDAQNAASAGAVCLVPGIKRRL